MNKRKNRKSDLDAKKVYFLEIGLIVALTVILFAFGWKKYDIKKVEISQRDFIEVVDPVILQTKHVPKPPPPKTILSSPTLLNIVENKTEVEEVIIFTSEMPKENEIWIPVPDLGNEVIEDNTEYIVVEDPPEFPGGEAGRLMYLRDNLKYPTAAKEAGIQGIVYVSFVVMPDGSVDNVTILRGIGGGCDEEAVRVVKNMPRWKPGEQRKNKVKVRFSMQIKFTLQK